MKSLAFAAARLIKRKAANVARSIRENCGVHRPSFIPNLKKHDDELSLEESEDNLTKYYSDIGSFFNLRAVTGLKFVKVSKFTSDFTSEYIFK